MPTVLVAVMAWVLWGVAWIHHSPALAVIALYAMFTPLHESSHRNLSSSDAINDGVGVICGFPLFAQLETFRDIHRQHHASTNHESDPDMWATHGPIVLMPLKWATLFVYYLYYASTHKSIRVSYTFYACIVAGMGVLWAFGAPVLQVWVFPQFLATSILAFAFDFLPHAKLGQGRHKDTRIVSTNFAVGVFTFMQSMHIIHHVNSKIVWWKYYRHLPRIVESVLIPKNKLAIKSK